MAKNESLKAEKGGMLYIIVQNDGTGTQTLLDQLADHKKRIEVAAPTADGVHYVLADIPYYPGPGEVTAAANVPAPGDVPADDGPAV